MNAPLSENPHSIDEIFGALLLAETANEADLQNTLRTSRHGGYLNDSPVEPRNAIGDKFHHVVGQPVIAYEVLIHPTAACCDAHTLIEKTRDNATAAKYVVSGGHGAYTRRKSHMTIKRSHSMVAMNEAHAIFAYNLLQLARDPDVRSGVFVSDVRNPKVGDAHCVELGQKLSAA